MYQSVLKPENERTEHAVFKVHVASRTEVWEINFLLSCFRLLSKFLMAIQEAHFPGVAKFAEKKHYVPRMLAVRNCVRELNEFVLNKQYNTHIDQPYGHINPFRQKLLKEQFYIDVLVKILGRVITKGELELWQRRHSLLAEGQP